MFVEQPRRLAIAAQLHDRRKIESRDFNHNMQLQPSIDDSFHVSMKSVAAGVQFLALMPVSGISSCEPSKLKFTWRSFRALYTLIYIVYGVIVSVLFFENIYEAGISAKNIGE